MDSKAARRIRDEHAGGSGSRRLGGQTTRSATLMVGNPENLDSARRVADAGLFPARFRGSPMVHLHTRQQGRRAWIAPRATQCPGHFDLITRVAFSNRK